jgi:hypothetical protein
MVHDLWIQRDCNRGPWPVMLDTHEAASDGGHVHIERQFVGMYHSLDAVSGIYLRSLRSRARVKIESLIAMEQYQ